MYNMSKKSKNFALIRFIESSKSLEAHKKW